MANDRVFLRCKRCGKQQLLYKYWPSSAGGELRSAEGIESFLREHYTDCYDIPYPDLRGEPGFDLVTESTDTPITLPERPYAKLYGGPYEGMTVFLERDTKDFAFPVGAYSPERYVYKREGEHTGVGEHRYYYQGVEVAPNDQS